MPSVYIVTPVTKAAKDWVAEHTRLEPWQWLGGGFAVEHSYIEYIIVEMESEGLVSGTDFEVSS